MILSRNNSFQKTHTQTFLKTAHTSQIREVWKAGFKTDLAYSSWKAIQASHPNIAIAASTLILWIWSGLQVESREQVWQWVWACPERDSPRRRQTRHFLCFAFVWHPQKTTEEHQTFHQRSASCSSSLQEPARTIVRAEYGNLNLSCDHDAEHGWTITVHPKISYVLPGRLA